MNVYVVLYHWCTDEEEGTDVVSIHKNYDIACSEMHKHMEEVRKRVVENYGDEFDTDFDMDTENRVVFGWYGNGFCVDNTWSGRVDTVTVEE